MATAKKSNPEIVMGVLTKSSKPLTAYQILEKLKKQGISGPPTVYRALETLQAQGQVHRIESVNAFVACHGHQDNHAHASSFILCSDCGNVEEIHDQKLTILLGKLGEKMKYHITRQTVELLGLCPNCQQSQKPEAA